MATPIVGHRVPTRTTIKRQYQQAFKKPSGPIKSSPPRCFVIGADMSAPFGVYINAECVAEYGDDQRSADQHYRLLVDVHREAMGLAPRYVNAMQEEMA